MSAVVETLEPGRRWRIKGSGVSGPPTDAPLTSQIIDGLSSVGVEVAQNSSGSAANADSYKVQARFLDGAIDAETGNYMAGPRGAYIEGPQALLFIAALLGRTLPEALHLQLRAADPGIDAYIESCRSNRPGILGIPTGYPVFPQTQISSDVLEAYLETRYEAQTEDAEPLVLRIGEFSPRLLSAQRQAEVESSLFISAVNPLSRPLSRVENDKRHQNLLQRLRKGRVAFFKGRGYCPSANWQERSVLALGVSLAGARYLGKTYEQNAVVWSGADAVPRMILLR